MRPEEAVARHVQDLDLPAVTGPGDALPGDGRPASDASGQRIVLGKREKGIDVLCALAVVRESQRQET
ncbi:MAG: hypothetical protein ACFCVF_16370, partial [Kineosporiaceae bacterium]